MLSERVVILGGGESGIGAALLATKQEYDVFLSDASSISVERKVILKSNKINFEEARHTEEKILNADLVVKSPGISDTSPLVLKIMGEGITVISEIEFGFSHLTQEAKVIAITGTNGKTTTTLLTHHLLKIAGFKVALGGNVGTSFARLVAEGGFDYYVVEVSSFQLDGVQKFKPNVAVLLNITPDHLDRYEYNFDKYVTSKFRITENLTQEECFIYCKDSKPVTERLSSQKVNACVRAVSTNKDRKLDAYLEEDHLIFNYQYKENQHQYKIPISEISLIGKHNMVNTMSAVLSTLHFEVSMENILIGLKNFKNAPHRLELVAEIDKVAFINDSKATNVDAVYYALDGVKSGIVWMVGGIDKGNNYDQLIELVKEKVKAIVCLGKDNSQIREYFKELNFPFFETEDVKTAVEKGLELANENEVVLLSPACSSFDLFKNYEQRGDHFRAAVLDLKERQKI
ncbi:MAG: UDP-N-acetylmuramoyl-L-alanine--D-glutamate ligase [Cytophagales bacterium]|nr:UDP-N-acetylmuramoyl-L-alanine--D-glutamate ligase [Cytophagales bacterium]